MTLAKPLEIDFSYGLADEGLQVQCNFQAESNSKHLFVVLFEEKQLTTIICETLELAPIEGVEIYDLKSE